MWFSRPKNDFSVFISIVSNFIIVPAAVKLRFPAKSRYDKNTISINTVYNQANRRKSIDTTVFASELFQNYSFY